MQTVPNSSLATLPLNATVNVAPEVQQPSEIEIETGPNFGLLLEVRQAILDRPETYNQGRWCGTDCCFAGHTLVAAGITIPGYMDTNVPYINFISLKARELLCLNRAQAGALFQSHIYWPDKFSAPYQEAKEKKDYLGMAKAGADYIDYFIGIYGGEE